MLWTIILTGQESPVAPDSDTLVLQLFGSSWPLPLSPWGDRMSMLLSGRLAGGTIVMAKTDA